MKKLITSAVAVCLFGGAMLVWDRLSPSPATKEDTGQVDSASPRLREQEHPIIASRELVDSLGAPVDLPSVHPLTVREALLKLHPQLDLTKIPDPSVLEQPAFPLADWNEVREEAERGLVSAYVETQGYDQRQLLAKAVTGSVEGNLEPSIAAEAAAREVELDSTRIAELARQLEDRGFELVECQRRIEADRLRAAMSRVGSGMYDRFEYVTRPADVQHSRGGRDVAEHAFWSGKGWVVQMALSSAEMPEYVQALKTRKQVYRALIDDLFSK
jgi:hypothetical protein